MMIEIALYPWQEVDGVVRELAEAEILLDAEYQAWLDEFFADMEQAIELGPVRDQPQPDPTASMGELEFMEYTLSRLRSGEQQPAVVWSDAVLAEIEDEVIGADFCRQPWMY